MGYDAFISYSHSADAQLAPRLQDGLQRLAKPWWRRRALNVFRDSTGLSANPGLWTSITSAMDDSEWFVFLASPEATDSPWVDKELRHWLEHRSVDRLLPVVTDGEWVWDPAAGGFDLAASTAVPAALVHAFREEPRHVDLRWARSEEQLDLRHSRFRDQVAEIAAPLHGLAKDELEGEDVRQHRRTKRWAAAAIIALLLLTTASAFASVLAVSNANTAEAAQAEAEQNADEAERNAREAQEAEDLAILRGEETAEQRDLASANAERATRGEAAATANAQRATEQEQLANENAAQAQANADEAQTNADEAQANATEAAQNARQAERNALESLQNAARAERNAAQATTSEQQARLAEQQARSSESAAVTAARRAEAAAAAEAVATQSALGSAELARIETARAEQALTAEQAARADVTTRSLAASSLAQAGRNGPLSLLLAARSLGTVPTAAGGPALARAAGLAAAPSAPTALNPAGRRVLTERILTLGGGATSHPVERFLALPADQAPASGLFPAIVSQDGRLVATVDGIAGRLVVWDLEDPSSTLINPIPVSNVVNLQFADQGRLLLVGEMGVGIEATTSTVWDLETGGLLFTRSGAAASPDGRTIVASSGGFPTGLLEFYDATARRFTAAVDDVTVNGAVWDWFSADGRWFLGSVGGAATLWDLRDGGLTQTQLAPGGGASYRPLVSPDGSTAVAVFPDGPALGIYSLPGVDLVRAVALPPELGRVTSSVWSPDGRRVALGGDTGELVVVEVDTGVVTQASQPVEALEIEFSPDGRFVHLNTFGLRPGGDAIVDATDGTVLELGAQAFAVSGGDAPLVFLRRSDGTLLVREIIDGTPRIADGPDAAISTLVTSPDGERIAVATTDGRVRIWDLLDGSGPVNAATAPAVNALTFTPDGRRLLGTSTDVVVWDLQRKGIAQRLGPLGTGFGVVLSPDGRIVFDSTDGDTAVVARDFPDGDTRPLYFAPPGVRVDDLLATPDGTTLAVNLSDGTAALVDVATATVSGTLPRAVVAVSGDGTRMATEARDPFPFPFPLLDPPVPDDPDDLADPGDLGGGPPPPVDPPIDGENPVEPPPGGPGDGGPGDGGPGDGGPGDGGPGDGGPGDGGPGEDEARLEIIDTASLAIVGSVESSASSFAGFGDAVALDSPGERVALLSRDGTLSVRSTASGTLIWDSAGTPGLDLLGSTLSFSPDGGRLAVLVGRSMRLYDAATGERLATQSLGLGGAGSIGRNTPTWSPDGAWIAVDGLYLMDATSLEVVGDLKLPADMFGLRSGFAQFTADGWLLSASGDGADVIGIDLSAAALSAGACELAGRNLTADEWTQYIGDGAPEVICPQYPGP